MRKKLIKTTVSLLSVAVLLTGCGQQKDSTNTENENAINHATTLISALGKNTTSASDKENVYFKIRQARVYAHRLLSGEKINNSPLVKAADQTMELASKIFPPAYKHLFVRDVTDRLMLTTAPNIAAPERLTEDERVALVLFFTVDREGQSLYARQGQAWESLSPLQRQVWLKDLKKMGFYKPFTPEQDNDRILFSDQSNTTTLDKTIETRRTQDEQNAINAFLKNYLSAPAQQETMIGIPSAFRRQSEEISERLQGPEILSFDNLITDPSSITLRQQIAISTFLKNDPRGQEILNDLNDKQTLPLGQLIGQGALTDLQFDHARPLSAPMPTGMPNGISGPLKKYQNN